MFDQIFSAAQRMASALGGAPAGTSGVVWEEVRPWLSRLAMEASSRWTAMLAEGVPCAVPQMDRRAQFAEECEHDAVGHCRACSRATCLHHACVDVSGNVLCFVCMGQVVDQKRSERGSRGRGRSRPKRTRTKAEPSPSVKKGPPEWQVIRAFLILELQPASPWESVHARYRDMAKQWHPDRFTTPTQKAAATTRFQEITKAYNVLREHHEKGAAA